MASQTGTTITDILQIISDWRGESSTNSTASRIRAVSRADVDFSKRKFWRTHLLRDQTLTGDGSTSNFTIGSSTYPMRTKGLTAVYVGGTTSEYLYDIVDYFTFKEMVSRDPSAKVVHEWYDAANDVWKMKINPTPSNGAVITYDYFWQSPDKTSVSDVIVCDNPLIIAHKALADIYTGEDELQKAQLEKQEAENLIEELIGIENSPAVNQTYQMTAIENSGKNRGIGSY